MLYDLIAAFYTKESDAKPRYWVPIGMVSPSALSRFEGDPFHVTEDSLYSRFR